MSNALNYSITLSLKTSREKTIIQLAFDLIMNDDGRVALELFLLTFDIKKDVGVLEFFLTFLRSYEEKKKTHNMFTLLLDPRFEGLCLVFSYVGCE